MSATTNRNSLSSLQTAAVSARSAVQQQPIQVISYNMHGFSQGFTTIRDLSLTMSPDVFIIQEHWLTPSNLNKFDMCSDYFSFGSSAMNSSVESGIIRGRPFGGVMILIKNALRHFTQTIYSTDRCVMIKIFNVVVINVYLPCVGTTDRMLILDDVACDINSHIDDLPGCLYLLGGDFNCVLDKTDAAATMINSFLHNRQLARCDVCVGCNADFTYVNDSLNRRSCIDYFLVSDASRIAKFNVIDDGSNLSDHLPIAVVCNCDVAVENNLPRSNNDDVKEAMQAYLRWDHADLVTYYQLTGVHLQELLQEIISLETESNNSRDEIILAVTDIYNKTVDILRNCANFTVPQRKKQFYKFWCNEELDCLKQQSIDDHKLWKTMGKPRHGPIFDKCRTSKLACKRRVREYQKNETSSYTNDLHEALLSKNGPTFWNCWRSKFGSNQTRVGQVDGLVDDADIVNKFVNYFAEASSNLTADGSKNLADIYDKKRPNYCGTPHSDLYEIDVELITYLLTYLLT